MEIREIRPEEYERYGYIGRQAFAHGSRGGSSWIEDPDCPPLTALGVWDEAGMQARLCIIHYQAHLGADVVVPMGGIGGVACLPASRGKGYVGALLKVTLARMREQGQVISSLFPFSWAFYRNYGWEWVGQTRQYSVLTAILKPDPQTRHVRAATPEDRLRIEACYTDFARRYRGMLARDEKKWNSILADEDDRYTYTYVYENHENGGETEGYLSFRGGKEEETWIHEFVVLTPRARRALLGLLRRHDMQTRKFAWRAPGDDGLYHQLCHNDIGTKVFPTTQGRIVDVAGAFAALKPHKERRGAVILSVSDEHADWNAGVWKVEFEDGNVSACKTEDAPQLSLSIQALSQAYYGTPTLAEIRAAERPTVQDENGYAALQTLLDGPPMWTYDAF